MLTYGNQTILLENGKMLNKFPQSVKKKIIKKIWTYHTDFL